MSKRPKYIEMAERQEATEAVRLSLLEADAAELKRLRTLANTAHDAEPDTKDALMWEIYESLLGGGGVTRSDEKAAAARASLQTPSGADTGRDVEVVPTLSADEISAMADLIRGCQKIGNRSWAEDAVRHILNYFKRSAQHTCGPSGGMQDCPACRANLPQQPQGGGA